jgi:hypothetical protein
MSPTIAYGGCPSLAIAIPIIGKLIAGEVPRGFPIRNSEPNLRTDSITGGYGI